MRSEINLKKYLVNDVDKLIKLREKLGISSWDEFAVKIDLSASNLYDHVYARHPMMLDEDGAEVEDTSKPKVYEKLLQLWHIKIFTLLNYLSSQKDPVSKMLLEMALKPLKMPAKLPSTVSLSEDDVYGTGEFDPLIIETPDDLLVITDMISDLMDLKDGPVKRGPNAKKPSVAEKYPLTYFMSQLSGISFRTYLSYLNANGTKKKKNESSDAEQANAEQTPEVAVKKEKKKMKGLLSKIYTMSGLLAEERRADVLDMMSSINEKHMTKYGIKRVREKK